MLVFSACGDGGTSGAGGAGGTAGTSGVGGVGGTGGAGGSTPACDPAACQSGACLADGSDCAPPCGAENPCANALTCCDGRCVDIAHDPQNCGACGVACSAAQFCSSVACEPLMVSNFCKNPRATIVLDGIQTDEIAANALEAAIAAKCSPQVTTRTVAQSSADGILDPTSGKPLLGPGDTLVTAGGGFGQSAVRYIEQKDAPIKPFDGGTNGGFIRPGETTPLVQFPLSSLTAQHDYFAIYTAIEPDTGTLVLASYGLYGPGTLAAAWFFGETLMNDLGTYGEHFYIYEWTDMDGDMSASAGDTFTLIASGS